jgi:hypothetical protein
MECVSHVFACRQGELGSLSVTGRNLKQSLTSARVPNAKMTFRIVTKHSRSWSSTRRQHEKKTSSNDCVEAQIQLSLKPRLLPGALHLNTIMLFGKMSALVLVWNSPNTQPDMHCFEILLIIVKLHHE